MYRKALAKKSGALIYDVTYKIPRSNVGWESAFFLIFLCVWGKKDFFVWGGLSLLEESSSYHNRGWNGLRRKDFLWRFCQTRKKSEGVDGKPKKEGEKKSKKINRLKRKKNLKRGGNKLWKSLCGFIKSAKFFILLRNPCKKPSNHVWLERFRESHNMCCARIFPAFLLFRRNMIELCLTVSCLIFSLISKIFSIFSLSIYSSGFFLSTHKKSAFWPISHLPKTRGIFCQRWPWKCAFFPPRN